VKPASALREQPSSGAARPPINLQDPHTILELQELVGLMEADEALKVVVFDSAHPDFFINHYDVCRAAETPVAPGPTGLPTFVDATTRLGNSPVVTIALIRGRNRDGGAELAQAFNMRFASLVTAGSTGRSQTLNWTDSSTHSLGGSRHLTSPRWRRPSAAVSPPPSRMPKPAPTPAQAPAEPGPVPAEPLPGGRSRSPATARAHTPPRSPPPPRRRSPARPC
jgi:hypothetical protein